MNYNIFYKNMDYINILSLITSFAYLSSSYKSLTPALSFV